MTVVDLAPTPPRAFVRPDRALEARIALLGLGNVGGAVAELLGREPHCLGRSARVVGALVRDMSRRGRAALCPVVNEASRLLDENPTVVIEALGGLEPARTIVLDALRRGIPVVTANKSLLAAHGDELVSAARNSGVALRCEATVLAGVPFLGTFAKRPLAAGIDGVTGVLNGTSNFLLSRMSAGVTLPRALEEAQQLGFAEPDPSSDVDGIDAAEKLALLIRQFAGLSVRASDIHCTPLGAISSSDLDHARELGGTLKAVGHATWNAAHVSCAVGPAFLYERDPLAQLDGVLNGIRLERVRSLPLHFTGPGAGPEATARTILDDVFEVLQGAEDVGLRTATVPARISRPSATGWFVRLRSAISLPDALDVADLFGAHGVWARRWGVCATRAGVAERALLTLPCAAADLDAALQAVTAATSCSTAAFPIVEARNE